MSKKILHGNIASEGIAIGRLVKIIGKKTYTEQGADAKKMFSHLKDNLLYKIKSIKDDKDISEKTKEILGIYESILNDPYFDQLIDQNLDKGYTLSDSIEKTTTEIADLMSKANEYIKERVGDIQRLGVVLQNPPLEIKDENPVILYNDSLAVIDFLDINISSIEGIITSSGSKISHLAIWARNNNIPYVYNVNINELIENTIIAITSKGDIIIEPSEKDLSLLKEERGNRKIIINKSIFFRQNELYYKNKKIIIAANIGNIEEAYIASERKVKSVGLFRTEFIFLSKELPPTEEEQYKIYKESANLFEGPFIIRTMDIGGDKELNYLRLDKELNPFLGIRGLRLSLENKSLFEIQIKAILRAAFDCNNISLMFPMVTIENEIIQAKQLIEEYSRKLYKEGKSYRIPNIGIMIEVPAAALNAEKLINFVDFMSIGTNDLIQYTMAMDRTNSKVNYLYLPYSNSIIKLVKNVIDACHLHNKCSGMCGAMAGELIYYPLLLNLGLDEFSMESSQTALIKMYHTYLLENPIESLVPWEESKIDILESTLNKFWDWVKTKNFT